MNKFAKANVSPGNCSVWGMKSKPASRDAAFLNGTLAHGLDYDDRNHSTTYTLAASFATGGKRRVHGATSFGSFHRRPRSARDVGSHLLGAVQRHRPRRARLALKWNSRPHRRGVLGEPNCRIKSAANTRGNRSVGRRLRRAHARRRHHGQAVSLRPRRRHGRNLGVARASRIFQRRNRARRPLRAVRSGRSFE